jgi:hypothetical protein
MFQEDISTEPLFFLFIALTALLVLGYFWGRRKNKGIYVSSLNDLMRVINPTDQTFTNIGGAIGYHAKFKGGKKSFLSNAEITILLLPRQAWLYFPISLLIRRWDRLFITLNMKNYPPAEGHLIESSYAAFRGPKITNEKRLKKEPVQWGNARFILYYANNNTRGHFMNLLQSAQEPGGIKHIAFVPHQKKCFVFMIPQQKKVAAHFAPIYEWLPSTMSSD